MKNILWCCIFCLCIGSLSAQSIFQMPELFPRHKQCLAQFLAAAQKNDLLAAEAAARSALKLFPMDANWHYNLACVSAKAGRIDEALLELRQAIEYGFSDVRQLEQDKDLAAVRRVKDFQALVALARERVKTPVANSLLAPATPQPIIMGQTARVTGKATGWEWNLQQGGYFTTAFELHREGAKTQSYTGPYAQLLGPWLAEGSAAGSAGELYVNRDEDKTAVRYEAFPLLTPVIYDEEAQQRKVHVGLANGRFTNGLVAIPTVGNSLFSFNRPPYWRSLPRMIDTDAQQRQLSSTLAMMNQLYVYDGFVDSLTTIFGDLMVARNPAYLISGRAGSERPSEAAQTELTELVLAMLSAMSPEVKREMYRRGMMVPTIQMLLRKHQRADYFTAEAHPLYFDPQAMDAEGAVKAAHALTVDTLPPFFQLVVRQERMPLQAMDYFDNVSSEGLVDTPMSILRIIRGRGYTRSLTVEAARPSEAGVKYRWFVVQGDPSKIRFHALTGTGSLMTIEADYGAAGEGRRVDIACVAVTSKGVVSAPNFVSLRYLGNEVRVYDKGQLVSIDYRPSARKTVYEDPLLSAQKQWKDTYHYDANGVCTGWTRTRDEQADELFDNRGRKIVARDGKLLPTSVQPVRYYPRVTGADGVALPAIELLQSDDGAPVAITQ